MARPVSDQTTLEHLRKDAKRWLKAIRAGDRSARARLSRAYPNAPVPPGLRDVQHALAIEYGATGWQALKAKVVEAKRQGRSLEKEAPAGLLRMACLDWCVGGPQRSIQTNAAGRLLSRHPEVAGEDIYTAVVCGELDQVRRLLVTEPSLASAAGGPRAWPPLLYLCSARLPEAGKWSDHAVAVARALLEHGADPNAWYPGGNSSIHYTALTCLVGRGEEQATVHPQARGLAALLLERGAEPYDQQVLYNVFAWHASHRHLADDDFVWLLDLIFEQSIRRGREDDWKNPEWPMLDVGGHGYGAWYLLRSALKGNQLRLAKWCLARGASADPSRPHDPQIPPYTLYEQAMRSGLVEFASLLAEHGASTELSLPSGYDRFRMACVSGDRVRARELAEKYPEYLRNPAALFAAAEHDRPAVAEMLLELGVSPDISDPESGNARPLHIAAYNDARQVARVLVQRGAEVDPRDDTHAATPIYWAFWGRKLPMVDLLAPFSRDVQTLISAGKVSRLRDVLTAQPELAHDSAEEDSLLFHLPDDADAAVEIVRLLLDTGVNPRASRRDGTTPEQLARARGLDRAADVLSRAASS